MIFNSIEFLIFFSVVFLLYFLIPHRYRWIFLLAASFFFYGYYKIEFLGLMIAASIIVFWLSHKISRLDPDTSKPKRKRFLIIGIVLSLSVLFIFRYTNFVGSTVFAILGIFIKDLTYHPLNLLYPIGVSFYSFKLVSYLVDVYNENAEPEKHLGFFTLYVTFFPQILAGPIDRAVRFIPELKKKINFDMERILSGFRLVVYGIFKKMVIADRLGIFVNEVFRNPENGGLNLIFGAYFYAFQVYCDFSGYSDIAIGISRILGFKSMENFNFPYFSKSMTQFWNRWHISLSTWLRDYLFLPIAYAVMRPIKTPKLYKIKAETWGYVVGMFVTMFLGGLWHGAQWTFVVWGSLHGIYLVVGYITKKPRKKIVKRIKLNKIPKVRHFISVFITFNLVSFAWIFFRAESFEKAFTYINSIKLVPSELGIAHLLSNLVLVAFFIAIEILYKNYKDKKQTIWLQKLPAAVKIAGYALFICIIIIFAVDSSNEFIYFQF